MGFFNRLFGKKEKQKQTKEQTYNTPISEIKKEREGYINLGESIFPIIKSSDDPKIKMALNNNPLLADPLHEGIVTCYVLDMGDNFEMLSQSHLKDFGLTIDDVRKVAMRNITNKVYSDCKVGTIDLSKKDPEMKPFHRIEVDNNFNPSVILMDDFWDSNIKEFLKSDIIAVSVPAKNLLFFTDVNLVESLMTMKAVTEQMYEASISDGIALTKNIYIRKNGEWILFLNTEEQMEDFFL